MSEPKWTPGPWRYMPHGGYCFFIHSESKPLAPRVATISYTDGAHSFHEADARLIAAAPELYEALEMVWDANETDPHIPPAALWAIKQALAKARGDS